MRRLKHNFKKGMTFVLTFAMIAGLVPAMSGGANTVQAATGSGTEPSVTAYATKDQLMTAFTPDANGTATTKGKLVFGKKSDGTTAQEWYILGKDTGVSGDNTIIVAASPIARWQKFNSDISYKNDENLWSDCVYSEATITEVYANHYGASELRDTLQGMATNTSYFTSAEQGLMNATTVTTKDTKNSSVTYTTTDKLYALQGDYDNDQYLWAGTDDSTVLAMRSYWRNGEWVWLRSPYGRDDDSALLAYPGDYVDYDYVDDGLAVQPASNLDLSSVLFASAATAASSDTKSEKITDSAAMTLRLDGTGKDIGTVTYNTTTGDIKVVKGTTSQTVALVVQGNDGTNDWYYSKQITGTETINASDIKSALSMTSDIDLSACKIWLEITEDNVSYAVNIEDEIEKINTTYVTRDELMTAFKPEADGTATNYGKLVFGKKLDGTTQEWYILGADSGVSGDNTIIFAASPIATVQKFDSSSTNKTDSNLWSECNYGGASVTEVFANHYGASELRAVLKGMTDGSNTSCFTTAEQGLMNDTTVTTTDKKNRKTYTTTDKLYALAADGAGDSYKIIKAGSDNRTVLAIRNYCNSGEGFWMRSPNDSFSYASLYAWPGHKVNYNDVYTYAAVQPASNLKLSSVLFASAAMATSSVETYGMITEGQPMILRLDGTSKDLSLIHI